MDQATQRDEGLRIYELSFKVDSIRIVKHHAKEPQKLILLSSYNLYYVK